MRLIHYMVRRPDKLGELIYPVDIPDPDYQGYGSFFISGRDSEDVDYEYAFYAIKDDQILAIILRRVSVSSFRAEVDGIGSFVFKATSIGMPARYTGGNPFPSDESLVRQMAPKDRIALEAAALSHRFYFIGYSPKIDVESVGDVPGPTPRLDRRRIR